MTNFNDDDIDLGLALGCTTTRNVYAKLKDAVGAGVNASSTVGMTFAASDPLLELVWSPRKGLSLKCAESGLADKRPFRLWNVGPTTLITAPSQSDRFKGTYDENAAYEKIIDQERLETNKMVLKSGNEIGCSSKVKIMNTADGVDMVDTDQDEENVKNTEKGFCVLTVESCEKDAGKGDFGTERFLLHGASSKVDMGTTEPLAGKINQEISTSDKCRNEDVSGGSQALIPTVKDSEAPACLLPNSPIKMEADNTLESTGLPALECTDENDVHLPGIIETCDQNVEQLLRGSSVPHETPPTHSRSSSYRRKGKAKALSDGNSNTKMSNDEEDSHESVESCNSTGLNPKGKKRWHFEQQFFVGSKRIRTDMHRDPATESTVAHNSSFVTWISNMVKGLSKSKLEGSPTLALTFTPNNEESHGKETNHQEIVMYDKDHDSGSRSTGFRSVFQSLYSPTLKVSETEIPKEDHSVGEPKKLSSADKILIDVPPISCHPRGDMLDAHMLMSNDNSNQSTVACKEVPLMETQITPAVVTPREVSRTTSAENKASNDSMSRLRTSICEEKNTSHSSEYDMSSRNQSLRSLWITRFSNKTPGTVVNIDNSKPTTHETSVMCRIEQASSDVKEISDKDQYDDVAASSKEIRDNNYERSMNNLHPIVSSAKFKKSEALASLFSRRLDALKFIGPFSTRNEYSYTRRPCFFCGKSGHDLRTVRDVPSGIFDVIRGLQLSRIDILKWMNSHTSLSHLDGFFLRLRLGRSEAGLGGTGYYVACINGLKGENLERDSNNCIYVNVCGVKCPVGSKYISNQDFLEDELSTWWHKMLESGGKVPEEGDLRLKLDEWMKLGF
ncbi:hypothetical protein H5410_048474 [Solanum commersonii]|uniref:Plus3 domain-containing protein n=1 Tax=Solanum commersonii TaxID=4109 RepID=A0A9J5XLW5_SOLCO|nr:hypothetical protein H5410_048474 [Solanum commersonii]